MDVAMVNPPRKVGAELRVKEGAELRDKAVAELRDKALAEIIPREAMPTNPREAMLRVVANRANRTADKRSKIGRRHLQNA